MAELAIGLPAGNPDAVAAAKDLELPGARMRDPGPPADTGDVILDDRERKPAVGRHRADLAEALAAHAVAAPRTLEIERFEGVARRPALRAPAAAEPVEAQPAMASTQDNSRARFSGRVMGASWRGCGRIMRPTRGARVTPAREVRRRMRA